MSSEQAAPQQDDMGHETDPRAAKRAKREAMRAAGLDPYPHVYRRTHKAGRLQEQYKDLESGAETEDRVKVAGRVMAMRNNGLFIDLQDASGRIQIFTHKDSAPEEERSKLDYIDLGDIIGAEGTIRRTPRGELSVRADRIDILTKSLQPLPEKYHGLTDVETRYRQRYLDLIMNEDSREKLRLRSLIVREMRAYFEKRGALEVETPILHAIMGGASAKPFVTHHNALDADFYLRVATELHLKRLIVGGFADAVYEIGRCFRNEGISPKHNPEFTSIEYYEAYADYHDMMDMTEEFVAHIAHTVLGTLEIAFGDHVLNLAGPWPRKPMHDAVAGRTGVNPIDYKEAAPLEQAFRDKGYSLPPGLNWGQIVEHMFGEEVEPHLTQPIHITDFPADISPLAKPHREYPNRLTERFESFINGWEIANAFTELNDPDIQRARFEDQVKAREKGDDEAQMLDTDFIQALEYGLPPTGGWGFGVDRFVMILTNSHNIREVLAFPTLKPNTDHD